MRATGAVRLAAAAALVVGFALGVPHVAQAQNTDDAHEFCAQGGGDDSGISGRGGGLVPGDPDNPLNETAAFGNGQSGTEDAGGAGGGGMGGGLGGSEEGGGAGGCAPDIVETVERPRVVVVERVRTRRLPTTGGADQVALMGGGLLAAGGAFVAASRRSARRRAVAAEGLVWDAFGSNS